MFKAVICSGAIALGLAGTVPDAEARTRRMVCEEWRDYYYSVETGEFLGWAGEPYLQCWYVDDPVSLPRGNHPHPDYNGGWGIPRNPRHPTCQQCEQDHEDCVRVVRRGKRRCLVHHEDLARSWCVQDERRNGGGPLNGEYWCRTSEEVRGRPVKDCWGEGIEDCVRSYAENQPGRTHEDTMTIEIGFDGLNIGGSQTSSITWGGSRGYEEGCRLAEAEASGFCLREWHTCEEAAGGCR